MRKAGLGLLFLGLAKRIFLPFLASIARHPLSPDPTPPTPRPPGTPPGFLHYLLGKKPWGVVQRLAFVALPLHPSSLTRQIFNQEGLLEQVLGGVDAPQGPPHLRLSP